MSIKHRSLLLVVLSLSCSRSPGAASGDTAAARGSSADTVTVGKTKLQAFQSKTGSVVVLGFSSVATIPGMYGAQTEIEAREATDASTGARQSGLGVEVKESGTLERKATSYVDYDELDALLRGIDYITRIDRNPTRLANFQADFTTRGNLEVSTFSTEDGKTLVALKAGTIGGASAYYPLSALPQIRTAVTNAKALLDSIRPAAGAK